jgi:hypothetical protein|tara:strand:+ start:10451 stop:11173 length:723 start_codon:yes stop_codon:yes gene_type:complete
MTKQSTESTGDIKDTVPVEKDVANYLQNNPDFFLDKDDLLITLTIPHLRGSTVSLVERQVSLLRDRNQNLTKELGELMQAANDNDKTFQICRKIVLSLVEAETGEQLLTNLEGGLLTEFNCTAYTLIIFAKDQYKINDWTSAIPSELAKEHVGSLMDSRNPILGVLRKKEQDYLFGKTSKQIKSCAVLPVRSDDDIALLAIGSSEVDHFQSGMGTMFPGFIADILARVIPRFQYAECRPE